MLFEPQYLLILGCSKRKRFDSEPIRAIERYDGSTFRLIRRFLRQEFQDKNPDIYILSAKFGLISSQQLVPYYDQKMTKDRVRELHPKVIDELTKIISSKPYQELFICVGRDYLQALSGYEELLIPERCNVKIAKGSVGKKLSELYQWLYGTPATPRYPTSVTPQGKAYLKGVELKMTPGQVVDKARHAIAEAKNDEPNRYISWYVVIDDRKVAPKWLVSQLTGLPVKAFTASEARRVLRHLGIQVYQTTETI